MIIKEFINFFRRRQGMTASPRNMRRMLQEIERYDRIFRGTQGYGFLDWDLESNYIFWDGGLWSYLGYGEKDQGLLSNPERFLEVVHPDDRSLLQDAIARHIKMYGPGEANFRVKRKHGGYVWLEIRVEATRKDNDHVRFTSGLAVDVTNLKEVEQALMLSEARHARILKASSDGVWEWTSEKSEFHFSSRCWEQIGFSRNDDEINAGTDRLGAWRKRIHEQDLLEFDRTLNDHFMKKSPFDVEYRILGKDDQWHWIRARGQMAYTADGQPWRMSGTNMDITELKRAEERVVNAKEAAEKASKAKSEFLSSMSHELRTPLNAILGFSQLFDLDTNLTPNQRDNIHEIKRAGEHLLQLVGDVLDLAKVESGSWTMDRSAFAPMSVILECISLVQTQADARGISIDVLDDDPLVSSIFADPRRFKQVFINLLSNAVKYNVDNGRIKITVRNIDNQWGQFTISDTGRGIPEALQEQVFQPFNRLGAEHLYVEGTGVGLVISNRLVEQMGGSMGFTSVEHQGSTFWFQLPLQNTSPELDKKILLRETAATRQADRLDKSYENAQLHLEFVDKRSILYIEDSMPNQRLMRQILGKYPQLSLTIADEGFSGLFEARTLVPDLVIMDINMPGMSGYETLEIMRRDNITANIPVIALSANAMPHDIEKGLEAGFDHYLTKPLSLSEFIQVLNSVFGSQGSSEYP